MFNGAADNDNTEGDEILCMRIFGIAQNVVGLIRNNIKQWKTVLTTGGEALGEVHIRRGIFQGDSLSSLLFVVSLIRARTLMLRKDFNINFLTNLQCSVNRALSNPQNALVLLGDFNAHYDPVNPSQGSHFDALF